MPSENTIVSSTTEDQNTTPSASLSSSPDRDFLSVKSPEYPAQKELKNLLSALQDLNRHCFDAELNADDQKLEDETQVRAALSVVGTAYYALHNHIFDLIAWTSERRRMRLDPKLWAGHYAQAQGKQARGAQKRSSPQMTPEELNSVLSKLGL